MSAMSCLGNFVATYTFKHKSNKFACDAKLKASPWTYVQELFEEQAKKTKKKNLKGLALAGMYAAGRAMNAKIQQFEATIYNNNITMSQLLQTISILKGQAAMASRCEHGNTMAPTCAYEIGDIKEYEKYKGKEDIDPNSTFPVAMGEIAEPQENRECTMVTYPPDNGDQISTNEKQDKFPNIGKIKNNELIISHATNVQQRGELSGVRWHSDQVKASPSPEQRGQSTHNIDCNATIFSIPTDNRKLAPPRVGVNFNNSLKGESSFVSTPRSIMKTGKAVHQVLAIENSQPKTTPVVKRRFNTLQKIKCYTCGLLGHISQFCVSSGEMIFKQKQYTTRRRDIEVYSPRWGEGPRSNKYENTKSYIPSTIKAENETLQQEIRQIKQERDEFVKEFQSFKRNIIDSLNLRNGGSNSSTANQNSTLKAEMKYNI